MQSRTQFHVNLKTSLINFKNTAILLSFITPLYTIFSVFRCTIIQKSYVCLLRLFACYGNTGTENIYNGCRTHAAAEAPYERAFRCLVSNLIDAEGVRHSYRVLVLMSTNEFDKTSLKNFPSNRPA